MPVKKKISFVDISGSAENLINYYSQVDLYVGYRVHAHIFMNSVKKLSLLISEDGRAKRCQSTINGMMVNGYHDIKNHLIAKAMSKLGISIDRFYSNKYSKEEIHQILNYEFFSNGHKSKQTNQLIKENFKIMHSFLNNLP